MRVLLPVIDAFRMASCNAISPPGAQAAAPKPSETAPVKREIRFTGTIQAVHSSKILVPRIYGQNGPLTLTPLVDNGAIVKEGDSIAAFDSTGQIDKARDARAKCDEFSHQVDQKRAQNNADAEKRNADLQQAEADLAKAEIGLRKGMLLSEIDRLKNEPAVRGRGAHAPPSSGAACIY